MSPLTLLLGTLAGICTATGIIFLFTGLRRPGRDRVQILFALFAFSYAGANLTAIVEYKTTSLEAFMRMGDWTAFFTVTALTFLLWFVSAYTNVTPKIFLWGLTITLGLVGAFAIINPNSIHAEISGIFTVTFPWGESITRLDASEGTVGTIFFLSELILIGFLIYACIKQWRQGKRRDASMLGLGLLFLIFALIFDILFIDTEVLNFVYLGDYGFIPLLIIMSLQLSNQVIRTDEELATYRQNLELLVNDRTEKLEEVANALQQSDRRTRALLDAPPDTAMLVTIDGEILATNEIGAERLGISTDEAIGKNVFDFFEPDIAILRKEKEKALLQKKQPIQWEDERGGRFYRNNMYPILNDQGEVESVAVFAADITEQKRLQKRAMEAAAAEERNRLARDLHDAVTQTIYSASLIAEVLPQVWERNPEEGRRNLTKLRALVRGALAEMRTMLFELRPAALEAADFETLLGQLGDALHGRTRIPVQVEYDDIPELLPSIKVTLYRIAQEAVNNIIKHASATQALIKLQRRENQVCLQVWDNGRGFDPQKNEKKGLGLGIMRERAETIGANLEITSQPKEGTQVSVCWQLPGQKENEA
jgi:PAS domain S-box-containing protein